MDGAREARRALAAGVELDQAFVCPELATSEDARAALERLRRHHADRLAEISPRANARLAYGDRSDGLVLVVRPRRVELSDVKLRPDPLVVITEDVEKPGNLGAILRSADAVGVDAVVAIGGTDLFNPNVIRASVGTVFGVPLAAASGPAAIDWVNDHGLRLVAARVDAPTLHVEADLRGPVALVLGSEANGLSTTWRGPAVESVRLPMEGVADSLNVSVAAGVLLYEAWRQRRDSA